MRETSTNYGEWRGYHYSVRVSEVVHPSGGSTPVAEYWIADNRGSLCGHKMIADEEAETYEATLEIGERHARAAIDKVLD
ncbi:hypothetical protein FHR96_003117 [Halomonas organivorans]|uniref:Uncharacterized protein n=1 Tax=Halomonas organivorans TaxID=257772 RepID=A0A7W5C022_9GAMM|nr:hypothetical protein [Halomonas organivorans]